MILCFSSLTLYEDYFLFALGFAFAFALGFAFAFALGFIFITGSGSDD